MDVFAGGNEPDRHQHDQSLQRHLVECDCRLLRPYGGGHRQHRPCRGSPRVRNVTVGGLPPRFLYVANTGAAAADRRNDLALQQRIAAFGYGILEVRAAASTSADAEGVAGIFISATVAAADVGAKFNNAKVPLINCETAVQDDMLFPAVYPPANNVDYGSADAVAVTIVGAGHALAGGLANGPVVFNNGAATSTGWALVNTNPGGAVGIATLTNDFTKYVIYGFDTGSLMGTPDFYNVCSGAPG